MVLGWPGGRCYRNPFEKTTRARLYFLRAGALGWLALASAVHNAILLHVDAIVRNT